MALWVCGGEDGCGTKYAVGLSRCPRCHNTKFYEDGDPMAKISRYGGASDATLPVPDTESAAVAEPDPTPAAAADHTEPEPPDVIEDAAGPAETVVEGGEPSPPEDSSSPSSAPPKAAPKQTATPRQRKARSGDTSAPDPERVD